MKNKLSITILSAFLFSGFSFAQEPASNAADSLMSSLKPQVMNTEALRQANQSRVSMLGELLKAAEAIEELAEHYPAVSFLLDDSIPDQRLLKRQLKQIYEKGVADKKNLLAAEKNKKQSTLKAKKAKEAAIERQRRRVITENTKKAEQLSPQRKQASRRKAGSNKPWVFGQDSLIYIALGEPGFSKSEATFKFGDERPTHLFEGQTHTYNKSTYKVVSIYQSEEGVLAAAVQINGRKTVRLFHKKLTKNQAK